MENGCWGVASGGIDHQRSFKVTTQGHLKKVCIYLNKMIRFVFGIIWDVTFMGIWEMGAGVSPVAEYVTRGHLRSLPKVI